MKQKESKKTLNLYLLVLSGLFLTLVIGGFLGNFIYNNKVSDHNFFYSIRENYCKDGYNYIDTYCDGTPTEKPKCCPGGLNHLDENGKCSVC